MKRILWCLVLGMVCHMRPAESPVAATQKGGGARQPSGSEAGDYFVAPNGDDENAGSIRWPWRTVKYALSQAGPGDVINLRAGIYFENEIRTGLNGAAGAPVTVRSYQGERARIDGGISDFHRPTEPVWECVDPDIQLYRSIRAYPGGFVRAWLVDKGVQLIEYAESANLESTNYARVRGFAPFYAGPGIQLRKDGHLYVRLQSNPYDLYDRNGNAIDPVAVDPDPDRNRLAIYQSRRMFVLDGASYLRFHELEFGHSRYIFDARNGSNNIEFRGCKFEYGRFGLMLRDGIRDWQVEGCEFSNGMPDFVYWTDVKNREREVAEAYPEFQSTAVGGTMSGFTIQNNLFRDGFDALTVGDGSANTRILQNVFRDLKDDAINLYKTINEVEVARNLVWRTAAGISNRHATGQPGQVYIHHNIIDNSAGQRGGRPGNYREDRWPVWTVLAPFSNHDRQEKRSWWKVYNNTIVTRRGGYEKHPAGPKWVTGNPEKYVYNNIFYVLDDRIVLSDDFASEGAKYDGNLVYRRAPGHLPLFANFGDGGSYFSLRDFRAYSGTAWEKHGIEADPEFDLEAIRNSEFVAAAMRERYRPARFFGNIASYDGLDWPGTAGVTYRGAVSPAIKGAAQLGPAETRVERR